MKKEILKHLIQENYIGVGEALWLNRFCSTFDIPFSDSIDLKGIAKDLLNFFDLYKHQFDTLSIEDELFLFSIQHKLKIVMLLEESEEFENSDEESSDDVAFSSYSKEQLTKLRNTEQTIISQGHDKVLNDLMELIISRYSDIFNGFDKLKYQRAKSHFWKQIGFEGFHYHALSAEMKKFIDDVYNASEPLVQKRVIERENEIIPHITKNFKNWIYQNKHKSNKTNLKCYLKENNLKISNANIDKILSDIK